MKNRLRVFRAELRWSQAELAERLGVSRQTINAIETEKYEPSLSLAFKMAELFDRPIEEIFEPELTTTKANPTAEPTERHKVHKANTS